MIRITCDRCGKDLDPNAFNLITGAIGNASSQSKWKPTVMVLGTDPRTKEYRRFELCENCEAWLYTFIFDNLQDEVGNDDQVDDSDPDS